VTPSGTPHATPSTPRDVAVAAPPWAARAIERLRAARRLPPGFRHVPVGGDARSTSRDLAGVEVLWRYHLTPADLEAVVDAMPDLRWVHSDYTGVDDLPLDLLRTRGVLLTNGRGIAARPIAEWIVLAVLVAAKQLLRFVRQSDAHRWEQGEPLRELDTMVVLVLGLGTIGSLAARWLAQLGVEVRAAVRRPRPSPPEVARLVVGDAWRDELPDADVVVCAVPLTAQTAGMVDAAALAAMKPGAWLVNVARGGLVDHGALLAALERGHLGGAVLDALPVEPLPPTDPLWGRPNVLVLPHVTWSSPRIMGEFAGLFADLLEQYLAGTTPAGAVDLAAGY